MKEIYLNQADGRKGPDIKKAVGNADKNLFILEENLRKLLHINQNEFLSLSQNVTTSLIYSLLPLLGKKKFKVFISSHEIRWFRDTFVLGKLPTNDVTYPNYVKLKEIPFLKMDVTIFDPIEFSKNPKKLLGSIPSIIILSHVSRITGQKLVTEKLYKSIKQCSQENILVIDGSQAVGAMDVRPKSVSDIYLGLTSKFIHAEPQIGFCWVRDGLIKRYSYSPWSVDAKVYAKEIWSAVSSLKRLVLDAKQVTATRNVLLLLLKKKGLQIIRENQQQPHIVIIPWPKHSLDTAVSNLKNEGFIVSTNIGYSISEPKNPGLRISLTPKTKERDLARFASVLGTLK